MKATATIAPAIIFTGPEAIPFAILNEINFYLKHSGVPAPTILRVQFRKGATAVRTINTSFNRITTAYQHVIVNASSLTVLDSTILDFDSIRIGLLPAVGVTMFLDDVQLSINPQNDLTGIMDINPNRCFSFLHPNGKLLKGHSIKVGAAPNTEQEQGFLLLATGDTNLEDLII